MSGSEGKQNNPMSAEDIEAEEMAQELMNMEMYEEGMGYEQMKQILQVINESRDMAGIEPANRSSQEVDPYLSEMKSPEESTNNIAQEFTMELSPILKPKPSFSYRTQTESELPAGSSCKSPAGIAPSDETSGSLEELFITSKKSNAKSSVVESESIMDALVKENESDKRETNEIVSQVPIKNAWHNISESSQNSQSSQNTEISVNIESSKSKKNQKIEAWKLDPTQAVIADNDVPLGEKTRPVLHERVPYSFCHHEKALAASEKVMAVLTYQLEEVADIWRRKHKSHVSEFQWGSPIKVGSNNGSLDKKPLIKTPETHEKHQSSKRNQDVPSLWKSQDRQCKRKAAEHIKDLISDQLDSDEDCDKIFEKSKKPKKTDKAWLPEDHLESSNSGEKHLTRKDKMINNLNSIKAEKPSLITDYDSDDLDNDTLSSLRAKNKKKEEDDTRVVSPGPFVPRRVVPPNPFKPKSIIRPRNNGEKMKRKSPLRRNAQAVLDGEKDSGAITRTKTRAKNPLFKKGKNQMVLNDDEIADELEKIDTEENQEDIEIKPLPVKRIASKLYHGAAMLLQSKKNEEQLRNAKTQEQIKLQEEEKIKKEELAATRLKKEEEERRHKETKDQEVRAKEERWKKNEASRDKDRRNRQLLEKKRAEEAAKNQITMNVDNDAEDDDENVIITNADIEHCRLEERVQCPICHLEFSQKDIQNHAATCDQFDEVDEPGGSRRLASDDDVHVNDDHEVFLCHICSKFSTPNGIMYEEHVNTCLQRKRGEGSSRTQLDTPTVVVEVPTSPVRCYVPISQQTESAINYKEQHPKQLVKPKAFGNRRPKR